MHMATKFCTQLISSLAIHFLHTEDLNILKILIRILNAKKELAASAKKKMKEI